MLPVLPAGVLGNMGKSGDVCNVIFGRPAVFSRHKNAQSVHLRKHWTVQGILILIGGLGCLIKEVLKDNGHDTWKCKFANSFLPYFQ